MSYVCNPVTYLKANHNSFHKLLKSVCMDVEAARCILIPTAAMIKELATDVNKFSVVKDGHPEKLSQTKSRIMAFIVNEVINADFTKTMNVGNALGQAIEVSPVVSGKFTIKSGADLKTVCECQITADKGYPLGRDSTQHRNISFATIIKGDIATNGKKFVREYASRKLIGGDEISDSMFPASDDFQNLKQRMFEELITISEKSGKDVFIPAVAGIISIVEKHGTEQEKKILAAMLVGDAPVEYALIMQPYKNKQYINQKLAQLLAPVYNPERLVGGSYESNRQNFLDNYSYNEPRNTVSRLVGGYEKVRNVQNTFSELYSNFYGGFDAPITHTEKLSIDEMAFTGHKILRGGSENISQFGSMIQLRGGSNQSKFENKAYWNSMVGKMDNSAQEFFKSEYLVGASQSCKYSNPPTMPKHLHNFLALN